MLLEVHAGTIPEPFREMIDEPAYARSVKYAARSRFSQKGEHLPNVNYRGSFQPTSWSEARFQAHLGPSASAWIFFVGRRWPLPRCLSTGWQIVLEERFGFNTTTRTQWPDGPDQGPPACDRAGVSGVAAGFEMC